MRGGRGEPGPLRAGSFAAGGPAVSNWAASETSNWAPSDGSAAAAEASPTDDPWETLKRESAATPAPATPWRTGTAAAPRKSGRVLYDARATAAPAPVAPPPAVAAAEPAPAKPRQLEPWEIRAELWALEQDKPWRFEKELKAIRAECRAAEIEARTVRAGLVSIANEVMRLRSEMDLAETDLNAAGIGLRASGAGPDVFEAELDLMVTKFRTVRAAEAEPEPQVGECVAQSAERATVVDCDARGAFEITKQIPKAERCPDVDQPFVIKDDAQSCLVPVPAGRR
ncbi:hypothetical protein [Dactylosporangium sp. NPDC049140]|uniref:hypothetical protein n=1 Tax=Dactylosporangium sp. NPDC049140 TaxID=3155647 RepID=UPI0033C2D7D7